MKSTFEELFNNGYVFLAIYQKVFKPLLVNGCLDCRSLAVDIKKASAPIKGFLDNPPTIDKLLNYQFNSRFFQIWDSCLILERIIFSRVFSEQQALTHNQIRQFLRDRIQMGDDFSYHSLLNYDFYRGWGELRDTLVREGITEANLKAVLESADTKKDIQSFLFLNRVIGIQEFSVKEEVYSLLGYVCSMLAPEGRIEDAIQDIILRCNHEKTFFRRIKSLSITNDIIHDSSYPIVFVHSIHDVERTVLDSERIATFYRGHSDMNYLFVPSLFRDERFMKNEGRVLRYIDEKVSDPVFKELSSIIDKQFYIQHFASNTRLLDVTKDVRVALFFACCENAEKDGQLLIAQARISKIQKPDSRYVKNICDSIYDDELKLLLESLSEATDLGTVPQFHEYCSSLRKRGVQSIVVRNLGIKRNYLVDVGGYEQVGNYRSDAQKGCFILFGHTYNVLRNTPSRMPFYGEVKNKVIYCIPHDCKSHILRELDKEGINLSKLMGDVKSAQCEAFSKLK